MGRRTLVGCFRVPPMRRILAPLFRRFACPLLYCRTNCRLMPVPSGTRRRSNQCYWQGQPRPDDRHEAPSALDGLTERQHADAGVFEAIRDALRRRYFAEAREGFAIGL